MNPERRGGIVEGYKKLNKLTRNGAILVAFGAAAVGNAVIASIALGAAFVDQAQITIIDKFQNKGQKASSSA